jgi:sulfate adenylyltransferase subunit 1 (EFTu-like GTPase family)
MTQAIAGWGGPPVPEGATAELRVRRLEHMESPAAHTVVWIELTSIRTGNQVLLGLAELEQRDHVRGLVNRLNVGTTTRTRANLNEIASYRDTTNIEEVIYPSVPGVGAFLFEGKAGTLPVGYRMRWKTIPAQIPTTD